MGSVQGIQENEGGFTARQKRQGYTREKQPLWKPWTTVWRVAHLIPQHYYDCKREDYYHEYKWSLSGERRGDLIR